MALLTMNSCQGDTVLVVHLVFYVSTLVARRWMRVCSVRFQFYGKNFGLKQPLPRLWNIKLV